MITTRKWIVRLVAACVVPTIGVSVFLLTDNYRLQKDIAYRDTVLQARNIAAVIEQDFSGVESSLRVLATSPTLQGGDLQAYHTRLVDALPFENADNYLLIDRNGQQVLNTWKPYGTTLPATRAPEMIKRVFEQRETVLYGPFTSAVTNRTIISIGVPVHRDGAVIYSLNAGIDPKRIDDILNRIKLPEGWIPAVINTEGTIVARGTDSARFVGQKAIDAFLVQLGKTTEGVLLAPTKEGIPSIIGYSKMQNHPWYVGVAAPETVIKENLHRALLIAIANVVGAFLLSYAFAARAGRALLDRE